MARVKFSEEILGELIVAIDQVHDRFARFGFSRGEVVELCLYQGITKTRACVERMEEERRAARPACGQISIHV